MLTVIPALAIGFGLSLFTLADGRFVGAVHFGPWTTWPALGGSSPDPYAQAHLARSGALPLSRTEGLRLVATTDSDGAPLRLGCAYRVDGRMPVSSYWTLVPVDARGALVAAPGETAGFYSRRIVRANDGEVQLLFGPSFAPLNWAELSGTGAFSLVLTLYDTTLLSAHQAGRALPAITRGACR